MKSKRSRTKNILIAILLVALIGVGILIVPYFIPNTPKFTIRKNYQSDKAIELNKCNVFDYDTQDLIYKPQEYLLFSKKINLSQKELEEELYWIKKLDNERFNYLETTDIAKYQVNVYVDNTILPSPQPTVTLIKNKFDNNKYKWVIVP